MVTELLRPQIPPAGGICDSLPLRRSKAGTLCQQAPANTLTAWSELRARPDAPAPTSRHHQLKGALATAARGGTTMEQWQYEVTAGGGLWYLVDIARRTLWIKAAGTGHPKPTD